MLMNPLQGPAAAAAVHPLLHNPLPKTPSRSKPGPFQGEVASKEALDISFLIVR